ncbi:MAG: hypothetical protein ABJF01_05355 [bacterium]
MTTTIQAIQAATPSRAVLRSIAAVAAAFVAMAIMTLIVDQILHWLGVFPPWGQISYEPIPYAVAVGYRTLFGVGGGFVAARLAPRAPLRHALSLGWVGVVFGVAGVVAAVTRDLGPVWYPIVLLAVALPAAWVGGKLGAGAR